MYPVYLQLREHHCISPTEPVPCGGNPDDNDDGINNAWLPPTIEVHEGDDFVRLRDAQHPSQPPIVYETFVEGKKNSHNPDTCTLCVRKQRAADLLLAEKVQRNKDKAFREATSAHRATGPPETGSSDGGGTVHDVRMAMNAALGDGQDVDVLVNEIMSEEASGDDSDDDAEIKANVTCSGIKDILITGQVCRLLFLHRNNRAHAHVIPTDSSAPRRGMASFPVLRSDSPLGWLNCPCSPTRVSARPLRSVYLPRLHRRRLQFGRSLARADGQHPCSPSRGPICHEPCRVTLSKGMPAASHC